MLKFFRDKNVRHLSEIIKTPQCNGSSDMGLFITQHFCNLNSTNKKLLILCIRRYCLCLVGTRNYIHEFVCSLFC